MGSSNCMDIQDLIERLYLVVEAKKATAKFKSGVEYVRMVASHLEKIARAKEQGKQVVLHGTQMPIEIFYAMDLVPIFNELYSCVMSMMGEIEPFLAANAEQGSLPREICSFSRVQEGMELNGVYLRPDLVVYSSSVCDNMPKSMENLAIRMNIPYYGMDRPYTIFSPQSMTYWRKEHEGMIRFLEEQTGRKMDYDRLQEIVGLSYSATELCLEIDALNKTVPCPQSSEVAFGPLLAYRQFSGTPEAVAFLELMRDELKERVAKGIGTVNPERFRLLFLPSCPYWDMGIMPLMEERYGAVLVADFLQRWRGKSEWVVDPSDPVGNLAYRVQFHHANTLYGPVEDWIAEVMQMAREYRIDGAIWYDNYGCRHGAGAERSIKDELERQLGVPTLHIGCDILDKSFISRSAFVEKLDGFFEMVEESKSYQVRRKTA